jgi:hypothetical protein
VEVHGRVVEDGPVVNGCRARVLFVDHEQGCCQVEIRGDNSFLVDPEHLTSALSRPRGTSRSCLTSSGDSFPPEWEFGPGASVQVTSQSRPDACFNADSDSALRLLRRWYRGPYLVHTRGVHYFRVKAEHLKPAHLESTTLPGSPGSSGGAVEKRPTSVAGHSELQRRMQKTLSSAKASMSQMKVNAEAQVEAWAKQGSATLAGLGTSKPASAAPRRAKRTFMSAEEQLSQEGTALLTAAGAGWEDGFAGDLWATDDAEVSPVARTDPEGQAEGADAEARDCPGAQMGNAWARAL